MATTAQDLLEEVNAAILDLLKNGTSITVAGQSYSKSQLWQLKAFRTTLQGEVAATTGTGFVQGFHQGRTSRGC